MILETIQSEKVYNTLCNKGIVWPRKRELKYKKSHIKKAYKRIAKYARKVTKKIYKTYPFWCSCTDIGINNAGKNQIKLILNVPDDFVLLSNYDKWVEYLDYSKDNSSNQFWKSYVSELFEVKSCKRIQAVIPYIKKEWIFNKLTDSVRPPMLGEG